MRSSMFSHVFPWFWSSPFVPHVALQVTARGLLETMKEHGCTVLSHGATGAACGAYAERCREYGDDEMCWVIRTGFMGLWTIL